jgi:AcrR family transcriptional regulator
MAISAHRTRHRESVRETIVEAARKVLVEKGYGSFSMRTLAAEVGCSPGTIYLYYKSKEHLLACVVEEGFDKLLEILEDVHDTDDPLQSLRNKLRAYVDFGLEFPHHYHAAFILRRSGKAITEQGQPHSSFDVLRASVLACVEGDLLFSSDAEHISQILWTAIHGVTSLLIGFPEFPWTDRDEMINGVIDMALYGIAADGGTKQRMGGTRATT